MLNEKKVYRMVRLARYEENEGKNELPVSRYYRTDYIGLALIKNFFLTTIGYVLLIGLIVLSNATDLLDNAYDMDMFWYVKLIIIGYAAMLLLYSVITYAYCTYRYKRAQGSVQSYYNQLKGLSMMYVDEAKKAGTYVPDEEDF